MLSVKIWFYTCNKKGELQQLHTLQDFTAWSHFVESDPMANSSWGYKKRKPIKLFFVKVILRILP